MRLDFWNFKKRAGIVREYRAVYRAMLKNLSDAKESDANLERLRCKLRNYRGEWQEWAAIAYESEWNRNKIFWRDYCRFRDALNPLRNAFNC